METFGGLDILVSNAAVNPNAAIMPTKGGILDVSHESQSVYVLHHDAFTPKTYFHCHLFPVHYFIGLPFPYNMKNMYLTLLLYMYESLNKIFLVIACHSYFHCLLFAMFLINIIIQ